MSRLSPVTQKLFGSNAGPDQVAQYGSLFAGSPAFTSDPATMMALSNWLTGWLGAAIDGNSPAIEDMNAVCTVFAYQIAYLLQLGVAEWVSTTAYYTGSLVNDGTGNLYVSRIDANTGNALTDAVSWKLIGGNVMASLGDTIYGAANGAQAALGGNTTATPAVYIQTGTGTTSAAPAWRPFIPPTVQRFLSTGSHTYTLPTATSTAPAPLYIKIKMVAGGGGGAGSGTSSGGAGGMGGNTTFSAFLTAVGGAGGQSGLSGGLGGGATFTAGPLIILANQGGGGGGGFTGGSTVTLSSGAGGNNIFGGGGPGLVGSNGGTGGVNNTGAGGSGGALNPASTYLTGGGGGAGGYIEAIIYNPSATYSLSVGVAGLAGTLGGSGFAGGPGGTGVVIVEEYYQ